MVKVACLAGVKRRCPDVLAASLLVAAAVVGGCESSSTVTSVATAPDAPKCQVQVSTPPLMAAEAGNGTFSITTQPECAWTASSSATWISGISPGSGQGNGSVAFRIAANDGAAARDGEIAVNDSRVHVSQRAPCRYVLTPASVNMGVSGGSGQIAVATASDCAWTASADGEWIAVAAPTSGTGNGTVSFTIGNNAGSERTGSVVVSGQRATIVQAGTPAPGQTACSYSISPSGENIPAAGGAGTPIDIQAGSNCAWTAVSNAPWITITSAANGTGNGSAAFTVAPNTGAARTGTLTVAGRTFTVTQAAAAASPCSYTIAPTSQNAPAAGSTGSVTVTSGAGCAWTATSSAAWITITSGAAGTGNGSVGYSVAANTGGARSGTASIAGQTFTVMQAAAATSCSYTIAPTSQNAPAGATSGTVAVTSGTGCAWTATSNASWLTVTSGATGTGNGSVGYNVAANTGAARTGTLTIGGQAFSVTQAAGTAPCSYSIAPTSQNVPDTASNGSVAVTTTSGCAWTASSNASWLTITSGSSGSGNGTTGFSVAANTGSARSGSLTVAGQTFTVNQAAPAPSCSYSIAPTSQNVAATASSGSVAVTTTSGCAWTATSNASWLSITSGGSGSGNGSVGFSVAANTGGSRSGTLTVAGQTFTVNQAAPPPSCSYSISPNSQRIDLTGGVGSVSVTTAAGCAWTASSNASWIIITDGSSGTGNGSVTFAVATSTTGDRTGTLTVAGQTATVQQSNSGGGSGPGLAPLTRP
jgi:hypothetical protein